MAHVQIEFFPPLAEQAFKDDVVAGRKRLKEEIRDGESLQSFFAGLVRNHKGVRYVFDPKRQAIVPGVSVILNEKILYQSDFDAAILKDGDEITLVPEFVGG